MSFNDVIESEKQQIEKLKEQLSKTHDRFEKLTIIHLIQRHEDNIQKAEKWLNA